MNGPREFATTQWSLVLAARPGEASETRARTALAELCRTYWYPLYAFVRYRGYSPEDAQDLTQAFFPRIIEQGGFTSANPESGRFRSYLLGALKHFLANEWHRARAQKRGGEVQFVEWDMLDPEARVFAGDLRTTPDTLDKWLHNYSTATEDRPADLGYWIGEEICRDYFNRAKDKQAAIENIATLLDPEVIVRESSYAWILP